MDLMTAINGDGYGDVAQRGYKNRGVIIDQRPIGCERYLHADRVEGAGNLAPIASRHRLAARQDHAAGAEGGGILGNLSYQIEWQVLCAAAHSLIVTKYAAEVTRLGGVEMDSVERRRAASRQAAFWLRGWSCPSGRDSIHFANRT